MGWGGAVVSRGYIVDYIASILSLTEPFQLKAALT